MHIIKQSNGLCDLEHVKQSDFESQFINANSVLLQLQAKENSTSTLARLLTTIIISLTVICLQACDKRADNNVPPTAAFEASLLNATQVTTLAFNSAATNDPDGTISKYRWDFGDGQTSDQANPIHRFSKGGLFSVSLTVEDNLGTTTTIRKDFTISAQAISVQSATATFQVNLAGVIDLTFSDQTFPTQTPVGVWTTAKSETASDFSETAQLFESQLRARDEIRVNTQEVAPTKTINASVALPADLEAQMQSADEPKVFIQIFQDNGNAILDNFEIVASQYNPATKRLQFSISPEMFTNRRTVDESWEVVIVIGSTRTRPASAAASPSNPIAALSGDYSLPGGLPSNGLVSSQDAEQSSERVHALASAPQSSCRGSTLRSPLGDPLAITGEYKPPGHWGVDYRAADGTPVYSMAPGRVARIGFDSRPLTKPDPRSGKLVKGWGRYILMEHNDGSRSLYAHLQVNSVQVAVNQRFAAGSLLAFSDNSGGSSSPHLHIEYILNGQLFLSDWKVDPAPCIGFNTAGGIQIRDNGSDADDAFGLSLNGSAQYICSTTIGASNTCSLGSLRSGQISLTITVLIAPDNVGTYEIVLSSPLRFLGGGTTASGELAEGASRTYTVVIP
jgi:murein DD-endopeptidase MepM/ murein hydrolase activator NlpD